MACRESWRAIPEAVGARKLVYHACMTSGHWDIGSATHPGRVRRHNEDRVLVDQRRGLFVVADGMGGHAGGELASELAVNCVADAVAAGETLEAAICNANAAVAGAGQEQGTPGMGTTIVALALTPGRFQLAWVGDSRAYRLREGIEQLSTDHSYVQSLVAQGLITPGKARVHPRRNIITRALGRLGNPAGEIDTTSGEVQDGDVFLLCTDGLTDRVEDARLGRVLARAVNARQAVDELIDAAMAGGGTDNISAIVVRMIG